MVSGPGAPKSHLLEQHRIRVPRRPLRRKQAGGRLTASAFDAYDVAGRTERKATFGVAAHRSADPLKRPEGAHPNATGRVAVRAAMREQMLLRLRALDEPAAIGVAVHGNRVEPGVLVVFVEVATAMPESSFEHAVSEDPNVAPLMHRTRDHTRSVARALHDERRFKRVLDRDVDSLPARLTAILKHEHRIVSFPAPHESQADRRPFRADRRQIHAIAHDDRLRDDEGNGWQW